MTEVEVVGSVALERRRSWVQEIAKLSGDFGQDTARLTTELTAEVDRDSAALYDHLRLCGAIPEAYGRDSSEEKLYSKYTDVVVSHAFRAMGLSSDVLSERGGAADVEASGANFAFVADAKAFRLSRTARNQKDFKVQAMDGWKQGKPFAVVVAPLYHLPARSSQIYMQAGERNVAILSYSHLAVLVGLADRARLRVAEDALHDVFRAVEAMTPTKSAASFWQIVNRALLDSDECCAELWEIERLAAEQACAAVKAEALAFLATERERLVRLSHDEALAQLVAMSNVDGRAAVVQRLSTNRVFDLVD